MFTLRLLPPIELMMMVMMKIITSQAIRLFSMFHIIVRGVRRGLLDCVHN